MKVWRKNSRERGNFTLEFALVAPVLLVMLGGAVDVGMMLTKGIQVGGVCRNSNVLAVRGIDLSQNQNQQLLIRTAAGLGMNQPGTWNPDPNGRGVIFLTKVLRVGPLECSAGITNWDGQPASCPNYGNYVIANRISIGNATRWQSPIGSPATPQKPNGDLYDSDIATNTGNIAQGFPGIISLSLDQFTYVSEVYADISAYNLFSIVNTSLLYARNLS